MIKQIKEKDYISVPKDFKSIHDLKELANKVKTYIDLKNNLENYKRQYFDSFLMTKEEVLKYIADEEQLKYIPSDAHRTIYDVEKGEEIKIYFKTLDEYLTYEGDCYEHDVKYIINTHKKEIYIHREYNNRLICIRFTYNFDLNYSKHIVTQFIEQHSTVSRPHNPTILSRVKIEYEFDVRRNILLNRKHFDVRTWSYGEGGFDYLDESETFKI